MVLLNHAVLLTGPGAAAVAVVRLRGPGVPAFLERYFSGRLRDAAAVHGRLVDGEREIDDPLVTWEEGSQTADVGVHGGLWLVHEVMELARREGFEVVEGGVPLPEIAVDGEDELEREILQFLPMARTEEAVRTLLNQREAWGGRGADWRSEISDVESVLQDRSLQWLLNPPRIAIVGVPNAGKSTLANRLFGQERSIVAEVPGTTRDYVEDFANLGGLAVKLVDTPGLRVTGDAIEAQAIGLSQTPVAKADLRILLLDPTQAREAQEALMERWPDALRVSGKCDLGRMWEGLPVSAATGQGLAELELEIRRRFGCEVLPHGRRCVWTQRQQRLIEMHNAK